MALCKAHSRDDLALMTAPPANAVVILSLQMRKLRPEKLNSLPQETWMTAPDSDPCLPDCWQGFHVTSALLESLPGEVLALGVKMDSVLYRWKVPVQYLPLEPGQRRRKMAKGP